MFTEDDMRAAFEAGVHAADYIDPHEDREEQVGLLFADFMEGSR